MIQKYYAIKSNLNIIKETKQTYCQVLVTPLRSLILFCGPKRIYNSKKSFPVHEWWSSSVCYRNLKCAPKVSVQWYREIYTFLLWRPIKLQAFCCTNFHDIGSQIGSRCSHNLYTCFLIYLEFYKSSGILSEVLKIRMRHSYNFVRISSLFHRFTRPVHMILYQCWCQKNLKKQPK